VTCVSELVLAETNARHLGPILLGRSDDTPATPWESLKRHPEEGQVRLDVDRAFVYYPNRRPSSPLLIPPHALNLRRRRRENHLQPPRPTLLSHRWHFTPASVSKLFPRLPRHRSTAPPRPWSLCSRRARRPAVTLAAP